jgi:serine kinase of HPr protein (carbohydrate metabolism regulator)
MERINATTVAIEGHGVLLRGPTGAGKSDLALRLLGDGGHLVADDYTEVECEGERLIAHAPATIAGLLEVRGVGILRVTPVSPAVLVACIDLVARTAIERMPEDALAAIGATGRHLPLFRLAAFEASAAAKVRSIVRLCTGSIQRVS